MGRLVDTDDVASTVKDAIKDLPSREVQATEWKLPDELKKEE